MDQSDEAEGVDLTEGEQQDVSARQHPRAQVLYEAIRREGEHELRRPASALAWSGLAAGLSMGFSMVAMGLTRAALPGAPWNQLIVSFGYCVGFVIVIVARQQLFTENTLTPILPLLHHRSKATLLGVLRLWGIVLATNLIGTLLFAAALHAGGAFPAEVRQVFAELGRETLSIGFGVHLLRAVFAGWLIALMVWMLAGALARAFIVVIITYLIGLGHLSHVIAGSSEAFYAVLNHDGSWSDYLLRFLLPVGLGNVLGGTALVAALSHAQVSADEQGRTSGQPD